MKKLKRTLAVMMSVSLIMSQVSAISFANERTVKTSDDEAGYELVLDCDLEQERSCGEKEHTHTDSCYGMLTATDSNATDSNATILECDIDEHEHDEDCYTVHEHDENCYVMVEKMQETQVDGFEAAYAIANPDGNDYWTYVTDSNAYYLKENVTIHKGMEVEDGATIYVDGDCTIDGGEESAIYCDGEVSIVGDGADKLTLSGTNGIYAESVSIENLEVDIEGSDCGIQVYNETDDAIVDLENVDGKIVGGYAGIYVNGECAESVAEVNIEECDLETISKATSYDGRARKSGITVYVSKAEKVESSINITDSKVDAVGSDAGLSINNYLGDADATNSASSRINIDSSIVVAKGTNGTWSGIFASVYGQHEDADSIITITDSSVYAVSPNTGILTSSQKGESKIILDNSILGASGKTALSMIEPSSQVQAAELKNGSTYVQMTPDAVMNGKIVNHAGKTIIATAGSGITYDETDNYFIIPQGSAVTEAFTDGTSKEYTFNNQAGGIGGFRYQKEEIWGYDLGNACYIEETGIYYETLDAAIIAANASEGADTIVVIRNIDFGSDSNKAQTIVGAISIVSEENIKHVISRGTYTDTLFIVPAGSSLTLDDGIVFDGSNNWTFNKELYEYNLNNRVSGTVCADYAISEERGTVAKNTMFMIYGSMDVMDATVQNCFNTLDSNAGAGAIFKVDGEDAVLVMDGAKIDHVATYGANAVVALKSGEWYIKGDTMISNNFGGRNGGMCRNDYGQIYMSGGTIKDNTGRNVNGTFTMIYGAGSLFEMTGGTICGNSSVSGSENGRCATLYLHSGGKIDITGGSVCHNKGGVRGGIDAYTVSALNINRKDQVFENGKPVNENGAAAYTADNHPYIIDNVSISGSRLNDVGNAGTVDKETFKWWVTGGIYTQDVDEFCAEGYVCIPYTDSERTDDYIVVPGYRVNYYSVETGVTTDEATGEDTVTYKETLEEKVFHLLPRDKFWYEMDERANKIEVFHDESQQLINKWYTEKEMANVYNFADTKLESDLNLYGTWVKYITVTFNDQSMTVGDSVPTLDYTIDYGEIDERLIKVTVSVDAIVDPAVGTHEIKGSVDLDDGMDKAENYAFVIVPGTLTVNEKAETPDEQNPTGPAPSDPAPSDPAPSDPAPSNPPTPNNNGGNAPEYTTPRQTTPTVIIGDNDTPLGAAPEGNDPFGVLGAFDIIDNMVPLAALPATGSTTIVWLTLSVLSAIGLLGTSLVESKKRKYNKK